jgi:Tol biopolymer transport system component
MRVPAAALCAALSALAPVPTAHAAGWHYTRVKTSPPLNRVVEVALSANGRVVVELGRTDPPSTVPGSNADPQVVAYDTKTRRSTVVTTGVDGKPANAWTNSIWVSGDGRFVLFTSAASNLVRGDTNGATDVFLHDLARRRTTRVSLTSRGRQLPTGGQYGTLSRDGSTVAFGACGVVDGEATAPGQCGLYRRSLRTGRVTGVSRDPRGVVHSGYEPSLSADGRYVCFTSAGFNGLTADSPNTFPEQVYVYDATKRTTVRVPEDAVSVQGTRTDEYHTYARIDPTGRYVATVQESYTPGALLGLPNHRLVLADLATGAVSVLGNRPQGVCCGAAPVFSDDGRYVVYSISEADPAGMRLDAVYRRVVRTGAVERVSAPAAAPCASDTGCLRPTSDGVAVNWDATRILVLTDIKQTADDPDGWGDGYLVTK